MTDSFQISGLGLVVLPDFSLPKTGWRGRTLPARVIRPDGSRLDAALSLHVSHYLIRDPTVSVDRRWRVAPTFPHLTKDEVPIGSRVFVEDEAANQLGATVRLGR